MANNVFGKPVTTSTLRNLREYYDRPILAVDRARVALETKNEDGKDTAARQFNEAALLATLSMAVRCLIYNATGGTLKLVASYELFGCVSNSPYPSIIQNGQWAAFAHHKGDSVASSAVLVYESAQDPRNQWVLGWSQRDNVISKCYAEFRPKGYYSMSTPDADRQALRALIEGSKFIHNIETNGDVIYSSIGNTAIPIYEAILTKNDAM